MPKNTLVAMTLKNLLKSLFSFDFLNLIDFDRKSIKVVHISVSEVYHELCETSKTEIN